MSANVNAQGGLASRKPFWRLPVTSLRARIFIAMVASALMIYIAAGVAVMNRISDDFDERVWNGFQRVVAAHPDPLFAKVPFGVTVRHKVRAVAPRVAT